MDFSKPHRSNGNDRHVQGIDPCVVIKSLEAHYAPDEYHQKCKDSRPNLEVIQAHHKSNTELLLVKIRSLILIQKAKTKYRANPTPKVAKVT